TFLRHRNGFPFFFRVLSIGYFLLFVILEFNAERFWLFPFLGLFSRCRFTAVFRFLFLVSFFCFDIRFFVFGLWLLLRFRSNYRDIISSLIFLCGWLLLCRALLYWRCCG